MTDDAATRDAALADAHRTVTARMERLSRSLEDVAAFNRETVDAVGRCAEAAMKAAEEMNAEVASYARTSMEEGVAAARDAAAARSAAELVETQTDFAKTALDGLFRQVIRMNALALAASRETTAPMARRVSAAADMAATYAA